VNVELRAPTLDDLPALTDLINRDSDELYGEREESVESMRMWLTGPKLNPATDMRVALVGGEFRGYVDVDPEPEPIYWVDLRVPPSEPDEVRVALVDWVVGRARERGGEIVRAHTASVDGATKRLFEDRGMRVIRHFYRMRIELDTEPAEPSWADGITVRPATPDDAERVYEAHQESFEDHWEHTRIPFEEWEHWLMREGYDASLWYLAEENAEIAGLALNREQDGERGVGWVSVLGVRKPWRRRGLGRALLLHTFHEFRRRGFYAAALGVDADSLTGANKLYEDAGMRVIRRSDVYELTL
jgi:ribosomal protein S18 acetylase RimI-like enzyme